MFIYLALDAQKKLSSIGSSFLLFTSFTCQDAKILFLICRDKGQVSKLLVVIHSSLRWVFMLFLYYFVLDIAYQEFSETDGELDDSDGDNRVVEGDNNNILA